MTDRIRLVDIHLTPDEHAAVTANLTGWLQLGDDPLIRSAINKLAATEQARPTPRLDHIRRQALTALGHADDGSTSTGDLVTALVAQLEQARRQLDLERRTVDVTPDEAHNLLGAALDHARQCLDRTAAERDQLRADLADTRATLTATSQALARKVWRADGEQTRALTALDTWGQTWHRRRRDGATPAQAADIALLAAYDALQTAAPAPGSAPRAQEPAAVRGVAVSRPTERQAVNPDRPIRITVAGSAYADLNEAEARQIAQQLLGISQPEPTRRELLAEMTRVSVAAGLYDITGQPEPDRSRCPSRIATDAGTVIHCTWLTGHYDRHAAGTIDWTDDDDRVIGGDR